MDNIPNFEQAKQYMVNRPNAEEVVRQTLYDFQTYSSAGQTSLSFFQVPEGQSGKTKADTNMELAGQLPNPKFMLVESIEIVFFPGLPVGAVENAVTLTESEFANDVYAFSKSGWLEFFIGSKTYLQEAPLGRFPPKTRLDVMQQYGASSDAGTTGTDTHALKGDYAVASGRPYFVSPKVLLQPTQNFNVKMNWPAAVTLPSGQDARIGVILDGFLYRLSQ